MNATVEQRLRARCELETGRAVGRRLADERGIFEYFHPLAGDGFGGEEFTWTAAIRLAWN